MNVYPQGFEILYDQPPCLVVMKPGGVLTQAPREIDSLEVRVRNYLREHEQREGKFYLAMIHRLDRPVSGALLIARNVRAAQRLGQQFEDRLVRKMYWAWLEGGPEEQEGTWIDYVRKVPNEPRAEVVAFSRPDARRAVLRYRILKRTAAAALAEIELETGRMHQIRLQAASRGFPVAGDAQYGGQLAFGPQTEDPRARWIALHGRRLEFRHPMTGEPVDVEAPLPEPWQGTWAVD